MYFTNSKKNVQRLEGEYTNNNPSTSARGKSFASPVFQILDRMLLL